jgi:hypothetical protein
MDEEPSHAAHIDQELNASDGNSADSSAGVASQPPACFT